MDNNIIILDQLTSRRLSMSTAPLRDPLDPSRYYVFLEVEFDERGHQIPTRRSIDSATSALKDLSINVDFFLVDTRSRDIESGARASLLHNFPDTVRNVFLSIGKEGVLVWIDAKRPLDDALRTTITQRVAVFLREFGLTVESLSTLGEGNIPGKLALLSAIRILAPTTPDFLLEDLQTRGFAVPSLGWLRRRLDTFRRSGEIIRLQDGAYALNVATISALGTSQRGRSPDVSRLLALARGNR